MWEIWKLYLIQHLSSACNHNAIEPLNTALTQPKRRCYLTALIVIFFDVTLGLACFFGIGLIRDKSTMDNYTKVDIPILKVIITACVVTIISLFSAKFTDKTLRWINIICGAVIIFYGIKLLVTFITIVV